jgi:hypothetical protein
MRLRLFDRIRRLVHRRRPPADTLPGAQGRHRRGPAAAPGSLSFPAEPDRSRVPGPGPRELARTTAPPPGGPPPRPDQRATGTRAGPGVPAMRVGAARARIREAPKNAAAAPALPESRARWHQAAKPGLARADEAARERAAGLSRIAAGVPRQPGSSGRARTGLPFAPAHPRGRPRAADGRRHCGSVEAILWRQWDPASPPPREVIAAVDRLAELPERIKERLADGLDAIYIGPGGVPELDDMTSLRGVALPSGRASWDACAGAYGERKIVVGSRPSPTPDVMCHEVGHALDDLDSPPGKWQSDSAEFRMLYDQCQPHFASDFHRQPGGLGRKEFFADAFAAIASRQRPALVDMLSGDTRTALRVMLYFNRRYGI